MKDAFKGFYKPTDEMLQVAWKDPKTLFALDTNVLLNLYGYAEQTRNDFFELLDKLDDKLWIPHQVGLEYQRRRLEVVRDEKSIFTKIDDNLIKIEKVFQNEFEQLALKRRFPKLHENTEKLRKEINRAITSYKRSVSYWDDKQPGVRTHDTIRERLNILFNNKVGPAPNNQAWLDNLYIEGKKRFDNKIPPGFKDQNKSKSEENTFPFDGLLYDRQYGDLILWKQLIEKAKDENIKNVIFITDDTKEDWWYTLDSRGKKQIGPHSELQNEIYKEAQLDIFHMYTTPMFLESGKEILNSGVHKSSIEDASINFYNSIKIISPESNFHSFKFDASNEKFDSDIDTDLIRRINNKRENALRQYFLSRTDPDREDYKILKFGIDPVTHKLISLNDDSPDNNSNEDDEK